MSAKALFLDGMKFVEDYLADGKYAVSKGSESVTNYRMAENDSYPRQYDNQQFIAVSKPRRIFATLHFGKDDFLLLADPDVSGDTSSFDLIKASDVKIQNGGGK